MASSQLAARRDALVVEGLTKSFGTNTVLLDVNLRVAVGTVHGLVGLNGSGKSTLVKALSGLHAPDSYRRCSVWGAPVALPVRDTATAGMFFVQQDLGLVEGLTVLENVSVGGGLGTQPATSLRPLRVRQEVDRLAILQREMGWNMLKPDAKVATLSAAERSVVAIMRTLAASGHARAKHSLLILDEPTARLSDSEAAELFRVLHEFKRSGNAVIVISHYLNEVLEHCDSVTVLRDGAVVADRPTNGLSAAELEALMTGKQLSTELLSPRTASTLNVRQPGLELHGLSSERIQDVSLAIYPGEIVACTGLVGCGLEELPYAIMGLRRYAGTVTVDGRRLRRQSPGAASANGIGVVPDDRARWAVWATGSVRENVVSIFDPGFRGLLGALAPRRKRRDRILASRILERYRVNTRDVEVPMRNLSGGNQQKIVLGRLLERTGLRVLILHEPASGIDVDARRSLYEIVRQRVESEQLAVLLCSSDFEEVAALASRVLVFRKGRVVARLDSATAQQIQSAVVRQ